jgi:hypothetical protein
MAYARDRKRLGVPLAMAIFTTRAEAFRPYEPPEAASPTKGHPARARESSGLF